MAAIKTGRYTSEKKTRNIEQVKQLELQAKMKVDGTLVHSRQERTEELERLIKTVTAEHLKCSPFDYKDMINLAEREEEFCVRYH